MLTGMQIKILIFQIGKDLKVISMQYFEWFGEEGRRVLVFWWVI